jgi:hypothetical protein
MSDVRNVRLRRRMPLVQIDRILSARLGETRVRRNPQPAAFNRQVAI